MTRDPVKDNAEEQCAFFDALPRALRDEINYSHRGFNVPKIFLLLQQYSVADIIRLIRKHDGR